MRWVTGIVWILMGTCLYGQVDVSVLGTLPQEVQETSGLVYYQGRLYTHNDSGNAAVIYEIDTLTLEINRSITINNAENVDWEDLTRDESYLYIGDIGNNQGNRQDLGIYRVPLSELEQGNEANAERITYAYADQSDFDAEANSDWDAEALISYGDQLIIFTKQWQSLGTVAYSLPKTPGDYQAQRVGENSLNGLVSGAAYNTQTQVVYLLGYSPLLQPFLFRLDNLANPFNLTAGGEKFNLNIGFAQMEAICVLDENRYYLSSEAFSSSNPPLSLNTTLFTLTTEDSNSDPPSEEEPEEENEDQNEEPKLSLFIPFGTKSLEYTLEPDQEIIGWEIFDLSGRRIDYLGKGDILENPIDISALNSAIYYLAFYLNGNTIAKPFFID
ncbi:MAG: hypothetical protein KJO94_08590 [Eudoraea sp.]|nr:hypothetical protein [Eudoraea sp.]